MVAIDLLAKIKTAYNFANYSFISLFKKNPPIYSEELAKDISVYCQIFVNSNLVENYQKVTHCKYGDIVVTNKKIFNVLFRWNAVYVMPKHCMKKLKK